MRCVRSPIQAISSSRASFRDWAAERTPFASEVMEAALAHRVPDAVEAAYLHSDLLDRHRELMERWAEYVAAAPSQRGESPGFA